MEGEEIPGVTCLFVPVIDAPPAGHCLDRSGCLAAPALVREPQHVLDDVFDLLREAEAVDSCAKVAVNPPKFIRVVATVGHECSSMFGLCPLQAATHPVFLQTGGLERRPVAFPSVPNDTDRLLDCTTNADDEDGAS